MEGGAPAGAPGVPAEHVRGVAVEVEDHAEGVGDGDAEVVAVGDTGFGGGFG